jgi:hypothetical protein
VRRLEERVAELESLIPQESLDHASTAQNQVQPVATASAAQLQVSLERRERNITPFLVNHGDFFTH